jgi:hypothetical protein
MRLNLQQRAYVLGYRAARKQMTRQHAARRRQLQIRSQRNLGLLLIDHHRSTAGVKIFPARPLLRTIMVGTALAVRPVATVAADRNVWFLAKADFDQVTIANRTGAKDWPGLT